MSRRALVVGASGGLGQAIAEQLKAEGWSLVLAARQAPQALAASLGARALALDLADPNSIAEAMQDLGPLDGLVQAAGTAIDMAYAGQVDPQALAEACDVEVHGLARLVQASLPGLRQQRGALVALTTAALRRHASQDVLSTVPKAAAEAFIRAVAAEEGRYGVRANSVAVGVIDAGMFLRLKAGQLDLDWQDAARRNIPLGRFGEAKDVAATVAFLLGPQAAYITGQSLAVDGGYAM